jgi:hypothetical protein
MFSGVRQMGLAGEKARKIARKKRDFRAKFP